MTLWSWKAPLCLSLAFSRLIWSTNEAARLFDLLAARLTLSSLKKRQAARGWTWKLTRKVYQSNGQSDILSAGLFEYRKRANRSGSTNPNLSLCAFPSLLPFQLSNSYIHKLLQLLVFSSYSDTFCREPKDKAADPHPAKWRIWVLAHCTSHWKTSYAKTVYLHFCILW